MELGLGYDSRSGILRSVAYQNVLPTFILRRVQSSKTRPNLIYKNSAHNNRPRQEVPRKNYRVCRVNSPEPLAGVYCLRQNFNISRMGYCTVPESCNYSMQLGVDTNVESRCFCYSYPLRRFFSNYLFSNYLEGWMLFVWLHES